MGDRQGGSDHREPAERVPRRAAALAFSLYGGGWGIGGKINIKGGCEFKSGAKEVEGPTESGRGGSGRPSGCDPPSVPLLWEKGRSPIADHVGGPDGLRNPVLWLHAANADAADLHRLPGPPFAHHAGCGGGHAEQAGQRPSQHHAFPRPEGHRAVLLLHEGAFRKPLRTDRRDPPEDSAQPPKKRPPSRTPGPREVPLLRRTVSGAAGRSRAARGAAQG